MISWCIGGARITGGSRGILARGSGELDGDLRLSLSLSTTLRLVLSLSCIGLGILSLSLSYSGLGDLSLRLSTNLSRLYISGEGERLSSTILVLTRSTDGDRARGGEWRLNVSILRPFKTSGWSSTRA
jgi:hypothetical protein